MTIEYKPDELFELFIEEFGTPETANSVSDQIINEFAPKIPSQLIEYWKAFGECSFGNGIIWMVNPKKYETTLQSWLAGSSFSKREDLTVIARSAFGVLDVWGKDKGRVISIDPSVNTIFYFPENDQKQLSTEEENESLRRFWGLLDQEDVDDFDHDEEPLFLRALDKLGKLSEENMYGYASRLSVGGKPELENLQIYETSVYHDISVQMSEVRIVNIK